MTVWTPSEEESERLFDDRIAPVVFPNAPVDGTPTIVVLDGQVGAGGSMAAPRLAREYPDGMAIISNDGLAPFHPHFLELARSRSSEAARLVAEPTAGWVTRSLRHARTTGRSLLLEGTFQTPDAVLSANDLFARNGFATRVVVVATPRAESLLAAASRYLLDARSGRAGRFTSVEFHDAGFVGTRALTAALETTPSADRMTVVRRDGATLFDAGRNAASQFTGATEALVRGQVARLPAPQAMRWLSELRAMTDFALDTDRPEQPVAELLIELHRVALDEVLPRLPLPIDSQARPAAEKTLSRRLAELRTAIPLERPRVDIAAPTISPSGPDRGISR